MGLATNAHFYMGLNGFNAHFFMGQLGAWNFPNPSHGTSSVGLLNLIPIIFLAAIIFITLSMALSGKLNLKEMVWMALLVIIGFVLLIVINNGLRLIGVF
jgi:hypothetical protein